MSREGKLVKNTLVLSIGTILPKIASFITLPILTGYLTKEDMGAYDLVTVLVSLILPVATLQIQTAAFRFLIDCRDDEKEVKTIVSNIVAFTIPTSLLALCIVYLCLYSQPNQIRLWICFYFLADILVNTGRQVCRGLGKNSDYAISAIISSICKMVFAVICVYYLRLGLQGTLFALFAASSFSLLFLLVKSKLLRYIDLTLLDKGRLKEMLKYTWPLVPNGMSAWVMRLSDRLVVTAFMGISANAVYSVANKIPSLLHLAQNTFTMAWQENASIVSADSDASEYYSAMFRTMFNLMAGFFGLLIAAVPLLFKLLIRGDYGEAYFQMPVLFLGMFFLSMSTFLGGIYVAYKRSRSVGVTTTVAAVVNLVTDIAAIKWIGLYAASGSTLIAYAFLFVFRIVDVQKIIKVSFDWKHSLLVLLFMILESVICYFQKPLLNIVNIILGLALFMALNHQFVRTALMRIKGMLVKKRKALK